MILNINTKPNSSGVPVFTYTGKYEIVDDNNNTLTDLKAKNWRVRFLTSGELTITNLKGANNGIDVFLVGGGGGGASNISGSSTPRGRGGGGGGATKMLTNIQLDKNNSYTIIIGAGSEAGYGVYGEQSSAFGFIANGGPSASPGSERGAGNGGDGDTYSIENGGNGTKEFGVGPFYYGGGGGGGTSGPASGGYVPGKGGLGGGGDGGILYSGTSSSYIQSGNHGIVNTGGGGGGAGGKKHDSPGLYGGTGGSGIVIIRNIRIELLWEDTPFSGTVNATDSLNVRNIPSSTASGTKVNGTLAYQRKVKIHDLSLDTDSSQTVIWAKVQESDVSGWCNSNYLTINAQGIINKTEGAIIYSSASTSGSAVITLPLNTIVYVTQFAKGNNSIWAKITATYNGTTYNGYILREHINFSGN